MSSINPEQTQRSPLPIAEALARIYANQGSNPGSADVPIFDELYRAYTPEGEYSLITWGEDDSYREHHEQLEQRRQAWQKALGDMGISEQLLEIANTILNKAIGIVLTPEEIRGSWFFGRSSQDITTLQLMHALESQLARKYERSISIELAIAKGARRHALRDISSRLGRLPGNDVDDIGLEAMVEALASAQEVADKRPNAQQLAVEIRDRYRNEYVIPELRAILGIPEGRFLQKAVRSMTPAYIFTKILSCDLTMFTLSDVI